MRGSIIFFFLNDKLYYTWGSVGQGKVLGSLESR